MVVSINRRVTRLEQQRGVKSSRRKALRIGYVYPPSGLSVDEEMTFTDQYVDSDENDWLIFFISPNTANTTIYQ